MFEAGKSQSLIQNFNVSAVVAGNAARVFLALWPDDDARLQFMEWGRLAHQNSGGRLVHRQSLHLTLVFIGDIPLERLDQLKSCLGKIAAPSFELVFSACRFWRGPRVICTSPNSPTRFLLALVSALQELLTTSRFSFDRCEYKPHLTLVRNAHYIEEYSHMSQIKWHIANFVLVQSSLPRNGTVYEVIGQWKLCDPT